MRVTVRGFRDGKLIFEETTTLEIANVDEIAMRHARTLDNGRDLYMVELEFLDEPNPLERFLRFGTDPRRMVIPIQITRKEN